jgi:DNA-binding response OmpR family regulator
MSCSLKRPRKTSGKIRALSYTSLEMDSAPLLLVDDDVKFCRLLRQYLQPLGYGVDAVHDGPRGLERARDPKYLAVVLDVMLPGMNGWDILRELRRESQVPVLMLTALGDEPDRVAGLELGADDYLPKTYSMRELLARLRAVLRRSAVAAQAQRAAERSEAITVGGLSILPEEHNATLAGQPLALTASEYDILLSLAKAVGRVKSREQLLLEVADRDFEVFDRSIDVHIGSLRRKLGDDARAPTFIQTVRGVGYRMNKPGEVFAE